MENGINIFHSNQRSIVCTWARAHFWLFAISLIKFPFEMRRNAHIKMVIAVLEFSQALRIFLPNRLMWVGEEKRRRDCLKILTAWCNRMQRRMHNLINANHVQHTHEHNIAIYACELSSYLTLLIRWVIFVKAFLIAFHRFSLVHSLYFSVYVYTYISDVYFIVIHRS